MSNQYKARDYRYVIDHGDLYRMTSGRYLKFLYDCSDGNEPIPENYGVYIGSAITINKFTAQEFHDSYVSAKQKSETES